MAPPRPHLLLPLPILLAAGCIIDDPIPDDDVTVRIDAARAALVSLRPEGDGWQTMSPGAGGVATAEVDGPYSVAVVCDTGGAVRYRVVHAVPEDGARHDLTCPDDDATRVNVRIHPAQAGRVHVGAFDHAARDTLALAPGTYDFVAIDDAYDPPRVRIERGVAIAADTTIFVPVATDGHAMTEVRISTTGSPADAVVSGMQLTTASGTQVRAPAVAGATYLVPPDALIASDEQVVTMHAVDDRAGRAASVAVAGDEAEVALALPAGITGASRTLGEEPSVTWTTTEAWQTRTFTIAPDAALVWEATMLAGYAEQMGLDDSVTIPDPTVLQLWDPRWSLADAEALDWDVTLRATDGDGVTRSATWSGR